MCQTMIFKQIFTGFMTGLVLIVAATAMADTSVNIRSEQWDIPRHGEALIKMPELGKIAQQWAEHPDSIIEMRYPGGEEGELWVQELMDWMVALGIPSSAMIRVPGSGAEDIINLVLVQGKDKQ